MGWRSATGPTSPVWNFSSYGLAASTLVEVNACAYARLWNILATQGGLTFWYFTDDRHFAFSNLTASIGGNDLTTFAYSSDATFENITVRTDSGGIEGSLGSSNLTISNVWSASGAEAVGGTNDTNLTLTNATATSESLTLILLESQDVSARSLLAENGSVAVSLADTNFVTVSDLTATGTSIGLSWWTGANGTISNLTASNESIDAQLVGLSDTTISNASEVNARAGPAYFLNGFLGLVYPDGPLQTYDNTGLSIAHLTDVNCSFALQDVYSSGLVVTGVESWGNGTAIQLNGTQFATIDRLFAASDTHGLVMVGASNITVVGSTVEDSTSYGLYILDAQNDTFYGNNFVANDGSSALGTYDPAHVQVELYLGLGMNFTWEGLGNYWSDWPGGAPYPIASGVEDTVPAPSFLSHWLDFVATGLGPGPRWEVAVGAHLFRSSAPLIALPAWVLPTGTLWYSVTPPRAWSVSPRSGSVDYLGANLSVDFQFTLPMYSIRFVESGLPPGTTWNVTLGGGLSANVVSPSGGAVSFVEPNGTYLVSAGSVPGYRQGAIATGSEVTVLGANLTQAVPFSAVEYTLTWAEYGLPADTLWGVTVNGTFLSSNSSIVGWDAPNGTYVYNLTGLPGWHEDSVAYHGTVTVSARPVTELVVWYRVRYTVLFTESGLPNGTAWNVVFAGQNLSSAGPTVSFDFPNGTYPFHVFASLPTSLQETPTHGNVTVSGTTTTVVVSFSPSTVGAGSSSTLALTVYAAIGVAAAGVVVGGAMAVRNSRRPPPPESGEELSGEDLPLPPRRPEPPGAA